LGEGGREGREGKEGGREGGREGGKEGKEGGREGIGDGEEGDKLMTSYGARRLVLHFSVSVNRVKPLEKLSVLNPPYRSVLLVRIFLINDEISLLPEKRCKIHRLLSNILT